MCNSKCKDWSHVFCFSSSKDDLVPVMNWKQTQKSSPFNFATLKQLCSVKILIHSHPLYHYGWVYAIVVYTVLYCIVSWTCCRFLKTVKCSEKYTDLFIWETKQLNKHIKNTLFSVTKMKISLDTAVTSLTAALVNSDKKKKKKYRKTSKEKKYLCSHYTMCCISYIKWSRILVPLKRY